MTSAQFIARWQPNELTERAGAQPHFDDLCELLGVDKPRDPNTYCFERGAKKSGGGDGWAHVWKRGTMTATATCRRRESVRDTVQIA